MRRSRATIVALAIIGLMCVVGLANATSRLHACPPYGNTTINVTRGISCGSAHRLLNDGDKRGCGQHRRCRVDGYSCRTIKPSRGDIPGSYQTTCRRGRREIVFAGSP
jgi:hypothetical protein